MKEAEVSNPKELTKVLREGYDRVYLLSDDAVRAFIRLKRNYSLIKTFAIMFSFMAVFAVYFALYEAMKYPLSVAAPAMAAVVVSEVAGLYVLDKAFKPLLRYRLQKLGDGRYVLTKG